MKFKKLKFSEQDILDIKEMRENLKEHRLDAVELSYTFAGGCGAVCEVTCSWHCEPACDLSCATNCSGPCESTCNGTCLGSFEAGEGGGDYCTITITHMY
ncbi:MAG: hypothetical protein PVH61_43210 [Candidatus Aminicenantes bacterium]|jgi:hypothetical protein